MAVGDEVVINPAVSPVEEIVALGIDSPMGAGFEIYGEHRWGGHATVAVAPARNVVKRPANRSWEECAAYPLAYLTAYRMLRRARLKAGDTALVVGIGSGVSNAALALARAMGASVVVTSRSEAKRAQALTMGPMPPRLDRQPLAGGGRRRRRERWAGHVGAVACAQGGGRLVVCGGTSGPKVEVNLPRLFFKQIEIIGSTMGSYEEFASLTTLVERGLPVQVDGVFDLIDYPKALDRLDRGEQLGKIVLRHPSR